jgi:hypothetical protein
LSQGEYNPARINSWLSIVVDPLANIPREGGRVASTGWTAVSLMETIASAAMCVSAPDSEEQHIFAKAKSQLMEKLGGATIVNTAPLDWYDPAQVSRWPTCRLQVGHTESSGSSAGTGTEPPPLPPPTRRPLWAWRTLDKLAIAPVEAVPAETPATPPAAQPAVPVELPPTSHLALGRKRFMMSAAAIGAVRAVVAEPVPPPAQPAPATAPPLMTHPAVAARLVPRQPAAMRLARATEAVTPPPGAAIVAIERAPAAFFTEAASVRVSTLDAAMVSNAISTAADEASTSSVASDSFSLSLSYLVLSLSRAPWWSDFILLLDNWYFPGLQRASMIGDGDAGQVTGIPVALILTSDVKIGANWSESDRNAASSNTHFGPWALHAMEITTSDTAGEATLTIPGIQAIACIYRDLPAIPPRPDPDLVPAAPTAG